MRYEEHEESHVRNRKYGAPDVFPVSIHGTDAHAPPKTTIAQEKRFLKGQLPSQSPDGERYYEHSEILTGADYMKGSRTPGMGGGNKTNFARLGEGGKNDKVGPGTYQPNVSTAAKTSALDGALRPLQRRATSLG